MYFRPTLLVFVMAGTLSLSDWSLALKRDNEREETQDFSPSRFLNRLLQNYYSADSPRGDHPVNCRIGLYIHAFQVDSVNMEYTTDIYLREQWKDGRLSFTPSNGVTSLPVDPSSIKDIWKPDLFGRGSKVTVTNNAMPNAMMKLNATGWIWYVRRLELTQPCPMSLQKFPFDTQRCPMMFESFGSQMDTLYFTWLSSPVDINNDIRLRQFTLRDNILYDCSQNYTSGAYPCLEINFVLRRDSESYIKQHFLPTALLVALSWLTFWMPVDAARGRLMLLIPLMLVLIYMSQNVMANIPKVSYNTAMDVWNIMCMVMILGSLLEFFTVHLIKMCKKSDDGTEDAEQPRKTGMKRALEMVLPSRSENSKEEIVDKCCRFIFPLLFAVLVAGYFIVYTMDV